MGGLAEHVVPRNAQLAGESIETSRVGGRQRRDPRGAVAIRPLHVLRTLACRFNQLAQEIFFGFRQLHGAERRLRHALRAQ